jgi:hypothetical protein
MLGHPETNIKEVGTIPKQFFMIRRNLLVLSALVVAAALLITGCKKDANEVSESADAFSVAQAKQWYANNVDNKQNNLNSNSRKKIGKFAPLWDKAFNSNDDKYEVVETPLRFDHNPGFTSSLDPSKSKVNGITRMLILKNKKSGEIKSALMHVFSNSGTEEKTITYSKRNGGFSGTIFFTDTEGNFVNGWQYEKGKITGKSNKEMTLSNPAGKSLPPGEGGTCQTTEILWFERDCIEYYNGNYECGAWRYLYSTYQTYCIPTGSGGGGGGYGDDGGAGTGTPNCSIQQLQAQADAVIAGGISVAENFITTGTGIQITGANGEITRDADFTWDFFTGTFLNYRWKYVSHVDAVHKLEAGVWKWKSLAHITESIVGSYPFVIELKMNTATSSISASGILAGMELNFNTKVIVSCGGLNVTAKSHDEDGSFRDKKPTL